jgi:hypothetical protein
MISILENFEDLVDEILFIYLFIKHAIFKKFIEHLLHTRYIFKAGIKAMFPLIQLILLWEKPNNNYSNYELGKILI